MAFAKKVDTLDTRSYTMAEVMPMDTVGARIKYARQKAGLSQEKLARTIETTKSTISKYELGKRQPRVEQLRAIATALGVSLGDLIGWPDDLAQAVAKQHPSDTVELDEHGNPSFFYDSEEERKTRLDCDSSKGSAEPGTVSYAKLCDMNEHNFLERIDHAVGKLNLIGKQKAAERVEELTEIPKYREDKTPPEGR